MRAVGQPTRFTGRPPARHGGIPTCVTQAACIMFRPDAMLLSGISRCSFRFPSSARRLPTCRDSPRNASSSRTTACVQVWIKVMQLMHILGLSPFFRNRPRSGAASAGLRHHSCPPRPYASHRSRSWCGQLVKPSFGIPLPNGYNRTEICHCLPTSGRMFTLGNTPAPVPAIRRVPVARRAHSARRRCKRTETQRRHIEHSVCTTVP